MTNTRTQLGEAVRVRMEKLIIFGEVRHCHAEGATFKTGIKISEVVGHRGLCRRLTDEQIDLLALGRSPGPRNGFYANFHVRYCESCVEQLRATKTFFAKARCA